MASGGHSHGIDGWRALDYVLLFVVGVAAGILLVAVTKHHPPQDEGPA